MANEKDVRSSDRVALEVPIKFAGTDAQGVSFVEDARTVLVNRNGAKVLSSRKLAPDQEVSVRCLSTGLEVDARVVGQMGEELDGYYYGISFLGSTVNLWGIEFPSVEKSDQAVGRALLECVGCHQREVVYLDEFEVEVLQANRTLTRYCMHCTQSTLWKTSTAQAPETSAPAAQPAGGPDKRREPRRELRVQACIRSINFGDEIVWTRNVSRGGLCFESRCQYVQGWRVEVAMPYSRGGGNIYLLARIARVQPLAADELNLVGVSYVRNPRG